MKPASKQWGLWELVPLVESARVDRANKTGPYEISQDALVPRHVGCRNYDACLGYAAKRRWGSFSCKGCRVTQRGKFVDKGDKNDDS